MSGVCYPPASFSSEMAGASLLVIHSWLHTYLQWPFPPGYFIGILGFLAAVVTFLKEPKRWVKTICVILFFGLMWCEIWMVGKDRDARDNAETASRELAQQQAANINFLMIQNTAATTHLADLDREMSAAHGNPQLIAELKTQIAAAQQQTDAANAKLLVAMVAGINRQLSTITASWISTDDGITGPYQYQLDLHHTTGAYHDWLVRRHDADVEAMNARFMTQVVPLMPMANNLRVELLKLLPSGETQDDRNEEAVFTKVLAGGTITHEELNSANVYLANLSRRVLAAESR
jgi:hypothetical protein